MAWEEEEDSLCTGRDVGEVRFWFYYGFIYYINHRTPYALPPSWGGARR